MRALVVVTLWAASPAFAQALHVVGMARATAPVDRIDVHVVATGDGLSIEVATKASQALTEAIAASARGAGAADVQLAAAQFTQQPEYDRDNRPKGTRYRMMKHFVVTLRAPEKLDALVTALAKTGVAVNQLELMSEKLAALGEQLAAEAVDNARKRAEAAAASAGVRLGKTVRITQRAEPGQTTSIFFSQGGGLAHPQGAGLSTTFYVDADYEVLDLPAKS